MKNKLFAPINVGPLELNHRVVVDWGHADARNPSAVAKILSTIQDPVFEGGMIIVDPALLIWSHQTPLTHSELKQTAEVWRGVVAAAKSSHMSVSARLNLGRALTAERNVGVGGFEHRDIIQGIEAYVEAAVLAKSAGFDSIELDSDLGEMPDHYLRSDPNRPSEHEDGARLGISLVVDVLGALTNVVGRERIGVRLPPFRSGLSQFIQPKRYEEALSALQDFEIPYVHLVDTTSLYKVVDGVLRLTALAESLRRAFGGILIAGGPENLLLAIELVENRWADAICFSGEELDAELLRQLRRARYRPSET